jgi:general stress protein YciG
MTISNTNLVAPSSPVAAEKKKRGFASMDRAQVREFARRGGVAAHRAGTAHEFDSNEARAAGRKGGLASHASEKRGAERTLDGSALPTGEAPADAPTN